MGENYKASVVDKNLKVHGFKNLYVNGSSVFRTASYTHPTYTIVKLALKLSDHLSKYIWKSYLFLIKQAKLNFGFDKKSK